MEFEKRIIKDASEVDVGFVPRAKVIYNGHDISHDWDNVTNGAELYWECVLESEENRKMWKECWAFLGGFAFTSMTVAVLVVNKTMRMFIPWLKFTQTSTYVIKCHTQKMKGVETTCSF
ncbi:MAG: hypothetical protein IJW24_04865 [Clostridia bacterium]|nr:hypothetical protein [Clostridia bacterium]